MASTDAQLNALTTLLQLERDARHAENIEHLQYIIANDTHRLLHFRQAFIWKKNTSGRNNIITASGISTPDKTAPLIQWLNQFLKDTDISHSEDNAICFTKDSLEKNKVEKWEELINGEMLVQTFIKTPHYTIGIAFIRFNPWLESEIKILGLLMDSYQHSWQAISPKQSDLRLKLSHAFDYQKNKIIAIVAIFLTGFIPIQETALAPASVIPLNPIAITSPLNGVIKSMTALPNASVKKGDLLFTLDDIDLLNRLKVAKETLAVTKTKLLSASQKAFSDISSKGKASILESQVAQNKLEVKYYTEQLERSLVRAPQNGVSIFNDKNDWLGKPVVAGEKVMTLADPSLSQIEIWLPLADAIIFDKGSNARLFLDTNPTEPLDVILSQSSYAAEVSPNNILAFRLKAAFNPNQTRPRLGLQGTIKIYGDSVSLAYYIFRRPYAYLRQWLGL